MSSTLLMGGGGHTREKDHQNVKSLIIFAHDCRYHLSVVESFIHLSCFALKLHAFQLQETCCKNLRLSENFYKVAFTRLFLK